MCFHIDYTNHPKIKVAGCNIACYKTGRLQPITLISDNILVTKRKFISSVRDFYYNFNEIYKTKFFSTEIKRGGINKGFHSYRSKPNVGSYYNNIIVVKCIIPKGTKYFYNSFKEEYVSEAIIIKKFYERS